MKLWSWGAAVVLALVVFTPFQGKKLAMLEPARLLYVTVEQQLVCVETDTGSQGVGITLQQALNDMQECASAEVFLDTADYLVVSVGALPLVGELSQYLRPGCRICAAVTKVDPEEAAAYLDAHKPNRTLQEANDGNIPVLMTREGRMQLVQ